MVRFSTVNSLWCVDTALMPLEALVVYVKELRKWAVAASQEDQCLAYGIVTYNTVPHLMQLMMKRLKKQPKRKAADDRSGEGEPLQSLHWTDFARYDQEKMVWTYTCPYCPEPVCTLPQQTLRVQSELDLMNELCGFLQQHPPVLLVWPSQPGGARLAYHIGHEERRDRRPTPLQPSRLPFEEVVETFVSTVPSPPSEVTGVVTGRTPSSRHQCRHLPSPERSPRKPCRSFADSDEDCHSRSRSPARRRPSHSGSETESCGHCSLDICSPAGTMLGSPEVLSSR